MEIVHELNDLILEYECNLDRDTNMDIRSDTHTSLHINVESLVDINTLLYEDIKYICQHEPKDYIESKGDYIYIYINKELYKHTKSSWLAYALLEQNKE